MGLDHEQQFERGGEVFDAEQLGHIGQARPVDGAVAVVQVVPHADGELPAGLQRLGGFALVLDARDCIQVGDQFFVVAAFCLMYSAMAWASAFEMVLDHSALSATISAHSAGVKATASLPPSAAP